MQAFIIILLILSANCNTDLFTSDSNSFAISMTPNAVNSNNTDVAFIYQTVPTAINDSYYSSVMCIDLGTPLLKLIGSNTSMTGFSFEIKCIATCATSADLTITDYCSYGDINGAYLISGPDNFTTTTTATPPYTVPPTFTSDADAATATYTFLASTPADLITMGLPAQGVEGYYRCFGDTNYSSTKGYRSATVVTVSTLVLGANVTLNEILIVTSGAYHAVGGLILAMSTLTLIS